jgi:CRISPR system Cascade subunit CasD
MGSKRASLAFYIDAPLQSWGVSSKFQRRATESYPTKSGVLGLVAAAMGIDKHADDEAEQLKPLASCKFSVFSLQRTSRNHPVLQMEDYHTVGGGFDKDNPAERLHISRKASGGPSTTIVTRRFYLEQARFVAILEGDQETLEKAAKALEDPKWGVWFGRKCCLPSSPLLPTLSDSSEQAMAKILEKLVGSSIAGGQIEEDGGGAWRLADQPVSFGAREFATRPAMKTNRST